MVERRAIRACVYHSLRNGQTCASVSGSADNPKRNSSVIDAPQAAMEADTPDCSKQTTLNLRRAVMPGVLSVDASRLSKFDEERHG